MLYYSTGGKSTPVSLKEAVLRSLAPDGGLYMPCSIPGMAPAYFKSIKKLSLKEIAFDVASLFLKEDVPSKTLSGIVNESLDFPVPVSLIENNLYSLELFHGPTMAFKDVGARFMSRLMAYLYRNENKALNVIVATSGDTGSAVAAGFFGVQGINVIVLFPKGRVSPLQQKQITTWGSNIHALEVDGNFDDCQNLARQMLGNRKLNSELSLTSANSINIARLIPQSFYYFYAFARIAETGNPLVFSVPSGNFGNLTGGLIARAAGLPAGMFIASTNINDVFPLFLKTGKYKPSASKQTISSAMDVGDPSNFDRIKSLMGDSIVSFRESMVSYSFSDQETVRAISDVYKASGYLMDPHGAVAFLGLKKYFSEEKGEITGVFLETAHPAKFPETMKTILGGYDYVPPQLQMVLNKKEKFISVTNDPAEAESYIRRINS